MNKIALLILFQFLLLEIVAQQDAQYTRYMFSNVVFNPSYIARIGNKKLDATVIHRQQWVGLNGAPKTFLFSVYGASNKYVNWGLKLENDVIGIHNRLNCYGLYAFKVSFSRNAHLSLGVGGGLLWQTTDWSKIDNIYDPDDPVFVNESILNPDFEIGTYFELKDHFYVGLAARHLTALVDKDFMFDANYFLTGGTEFDLSETLEMRPSLLMKAVFDEDTVVVADVNVNFILNDKFCVGVGYQSIKGMALIFQYWAEKGFKFGYGFDLNFNMFGSNFGSHEIMVNYSLVRVKKRK